MRRGSIFQLVLIGVVAGAIATAIAIFVPWLPDLGVQAGRPDRLRLLVRDGHLARRSSRSSRRSSIYAMINFRVKPGDWSDGPPIHGQHDDRDRLDGHPGDPRHRDLDRRARSCSRRTATPARTRSWSRCMAQQFAWQFAYPNGKSYPILHLPLDRGVKLEITVAATSSTPSGCRSSARSRTPFPARSNNLVITPNRLGHLPGHLHRALRPRPFADAQRGDRDERRPPTTTWYASTAAAAAARRGGGGDERRGRDLHDERLWRLPHFKAIPAATGKVGPDLDDLSASGEGGRRSRSSTSSSESIVDPNEYIAPGYQPGVMPRTSAHTIPPQTARTRSSHYLAANTK